MKAGLGCLVALLLLVLLLAVIAVGGTILFSGSSSDSSNGMFFVGEPTDYAYLGGKYVRIPAAAASELNLVAGAEVVSKGHRSDTGDPSLAAKARLHVANGSRRLNGHIYPLGGDVITAVNDQKITSPRPTGNLGPRSGRKSPTTRSRLRTSGLLSLAPARATPSKWSSATAALTTATTSLNVAQAVGRL